MTDNYRLWVDMQMSSFDERPKAVKPSVLEIAVVLTDSSMKVLAQFSTPIMEPGNHPGMARLETDPDLRKGYESAGLWDHMADGMGMKAADLYIHGAIKTAMESNDIPSDTAFTVVCRNANLTKKIIIDEMQSLRGIIAADFVDMGSSLNFFDLFVSDIFTDDEDRFMFRPNQFSAELNIAMNIEVVSMILSKFPSNAVQELVEKKGRRSL